LVLIIDGEIIPVECDHQRKSKSASYGQGVASVERKMGVNQHWVFLGKALQEVLTGPQQPEACPLQTAGYPFSADEVHPGFREGQVWQWAQTYIMGAEVAERLRLQWDEGLGSSQQVVAVDKN
jgi:hypothetical protein